MLYLDYVFFKYSLLKLVWDLDLASFIVLSMWRDDLNLHIGLFEKNHYKRKVCLNSFLIATT